MQLLRLVINSVIYSVRFSELLCYPLLFLILKDAEISNPNMLLGFVAIGATLVAFLVRTLGLSLDGTIGYAINLAKDLVPRIIFFLLDGNKNKVSGW